MGSSLIAMRQVPAKLALEPRQDGKSQLFLLDNDPGEDAGLAEKARPCPATSSRLPAACELAAATREVIHLRGASLEDGEPILVGMDPAEDTGDRRVISWLERERDRCHTSTVVIAQLAYWVRSKEGRQRQALQRWLTRLTDAMRGRIHGLSVSVACVWADQEHQLAGSGRRMPVEDSYIAATARRHDLTIVTGNDKDFRRPGVKVFNPFRELAEASE